MFWNVPVSLTNPVFSLDKQLVRWGIVPNLGTDRVVVNIPASSWVTAYENNLITIPADKNILLSVCHQAACWTVRGSIFDSVKKTLHQNIDIESEAHPSLNSMRKVFFLGVKAAGAWCWPLTPNYYRGYEWVDLYFHSPLCLHGVERDIFSFSIQNDVPYAAVTVTPELLGQYSFHSSSYLKNDCLVHHDALWPWPNCPLIIVPTPLGPDPTQQMAAQVKTWSRKWLRFLRANSNRTRSCLSCCLVDPTQQTYGLSNQWSYLILFTPTHALFYITMYQSFKLY